MAIVKIPPSLQKLTQNKSKIESSGTDVLSVLTAIDQKYSGFLQAVLDDSSQTRRYISIFLDGENIKHQQQQLATPVSTQSQISILVALAGG